MRREGLSPALPASPASTELPLWATLPMYLRSRIEALRVRGVKIQIQRGDLLLSAPPKALLPGELEHLRALKPQILTFLRNEGPASASGVDVCILTDGSVLATIK